MALNCYENGSMLIKCMLNLYRELLQAPGLKDWLLETREKKLHAHERADTDIKATQAHYTILDVLQSLYGFLWERWLGYCGFKP